MHTYSLAGVARRAFPVAAMAAVSIACSDKHSPTDPVAAAGVSAAVGTGNGIPGGRGAVDGQIAFTSNRDGNLEIYVAADSANAVAVRLTNNRGIDDSPAWSGDYKQIVFKSHRDGNSEIYAMNANGTGVVRLTNNAAFDGQPVYSPDGQKIAFTSLRDGNTEIYVMNADGTNVTRLTFDGSSDTEPTWSPDGSKIAFVSDRAKKNWPQVWIMNAADGSGATRFSSETAVERSPHWSPDGKRIAFVSIRQNANDLAWRSVQKGQAGAAPHIVTSGINSFGKPNWSRDGLLVVFTALLPDGQTYVAMDAFNSGGIMFNGATDGFVNLSPAWSR